MGSEVLGQAGSTLYPYISVIRYIGPAFTLASPIPSKNPRNYTYFPNREPDQSLPSPASQKRLDKVSKVFSLFLESGSHCVILACLELLM